MGLDRMDFLQAEKEREGILERDNNINKDPEVGRNTD